MAMGIQIFVGGLPLLVAAWVLEAPQSVVWSPSFVLALIGLSLPGTALVYWLWFSILERVPLNRANAFSFLIPIFGVAIGVLFYAERVGWLGASGVGLTLLGIVLVNRTAEPRPTNSTRIDP